MSDLSLHMHEVTVEQVIVDAAAQRPVVVEPLRGVSLVVRPGEIVGVLGTSGSGKSTLLRCAAGLIIPRSGSVRFAGRDPGHDPLVRRTIGFVLRDKTSFRPTLTGYENLLALARLHGASLPDAQRRIEALDAELDLRFALARPVERLGVVLRHRLALARALLGSPKLLVLDEPSSGLDPDHRDGFYSFLARWVQQEGGGVLLSTHEMTEAQYLCSRVLLLDEGKAIAEGAYLKVEPIAEPLFRRSAALGVT